MSYAAVLERGNKLSDKEAAGIAVSWKTVWSFLVPFPFGFWQVNASEKGLQSISWLEAINPGSFNHENASREVSRNQPAQQAPMPTKLDQWQALLTQYLQGHDMPIDRIPIDWESLSGTDFQKRCWLALMTIPKGETRSYRWIAEQVGSPLAVRAVGQANGKNPIPLVIPCHRVIASNGKLTGYMRGRDGGLTIKEWLLAMEAKTPWRPTPA